MSYLHNDPADFAGEAADGFVLAHRDLVRRVPGGVARATRPRDDRVAVVIGGGSGHYPAFAGLVGAGVADAAVMGEVFASPSAQQVHAVGQAVATPAGVLLSYGNYAGDVLNFDLGQERLRADGIRCETVVVTDDVSSASADEHHLRRGIAGDLVVFKTAGFAAARGDCLDEVVALASRANERTRTMGVAFSGTTLPGADSPLFTVPPGRMEVGMGIHGEPGIGQVEVPSAEGVAELLVQRLLEERPDDGSHAAVVLNGLGSVKGEELFVLYGAVAALLDRAGVTPVEPDVGEFATSFEMAGVSLTLCWLDEELAEAWRAPAYTPAYRKGHVDPGAEVVVEDTVDEYVEEALGASSEVSRSAATTVLAALGALHDVIDQNVDELGRLDAVAGDGDHGLGMQRGSAAALAAAEDAAGRGAGAGTTLRLAADAWADRAGGTSGALWGLALRHLSDRLGDEVAPDGGTVLAGLRAATEAVMSTGGARIGDKSLVDALVPFVDALDRALESGSSLAAAWSAAAELATKAAQDTAGLVPHVGRARPHVAASVGSPDPGAVSLALAVTAVGGVLEGGPA